MGKKSIQIAGAQPSTKASKRKVSTSSSESSSDDEPAQKKLVPPLKPAPAKAIPSQDELMPVEAKVSKKKEKVSKKKGRKPLSSSSSSSSDDEPVLKKSASPANSASELDSKIVASPDEPISPVVPLAQPVKVAPQIVRPTSENKKKRQVFTRVEVDPTKQYKHHESRDSWGANVNGKKFRKEKGKKKRCPNSGLIIDGAVRSVRLDI